MHQNADTPPPRCPQCHQEPPRAGLEARRAARRGWVGVAAVLWFLAMGGTQSADARVASWSLYVWCGVSCAAFGAHVANSTRD